MFDDSQMEEEATIGIALPEEKELKEAPKTYAVKTFMFGCSTDEGPKLLAFRAANLLVGRLPDNHLGLNDKSVSRRHATISVQQGGVFIEDMGSQNGTSVNGTGIRQSTPIKPGDILRIGHVPLFYFGFINPDKPPAMEIVENGILVNPNVPDLM